MKAVEAANEDLRDILPKTYTHLANRSLVELLKLMSSIPMDIEGDAFGKIYEYFLGKFTMSEGQKGGEFFTPVTPPRRNRQDLCDLSKSRQMKAIRCGRSGNHPPTTWSEGTPWGSG